MISAPQKLKKPYLSCGCCWESTGTSQNRKIGRWDIGIDGRPILKENVQSGTLIDGES